MGCLQQLQPFAACNSHSIKLPCCRIRDALGQDKGLASFKMGILFVCLVPVRVRTGHGIKVFFDRLVTAHNKARTM